MSEKTGKPRKGNADAGVLGSLPATRPTRMGGGGRGANGQSSAKRTASSKARATTTASAAAKPKAKAGAARRASTKSKASARPKAAEARPAGITTTEPAPGTPAVPAREPESPHRPRPVRAGSPALAESTERARADAPEPLEPGASPPTGTELVTTAIQAAGELAQIGLKLSGHALKRAVDKLPKP